MHTNVEQIFTFIDQESTFIEEQQSATYLEGVVYALELWLEQKKVPVITNPTKEQIRKAIQLAILKGMKASSQVNHQMTPDAIGLLVSYFVQVVAKDKKELSILDPAFGTGNLLYTVMNALPFENHAYGVEIDELLIQLAAQTGELLTHDIQLFRQDALKPLLIDPVDIVVSDLPVGYYPDAETAQDYFLHSTEEMSYAHHLFIEQSMKHVKPGGYLYFLVPNTIFETKQAPQLHKFIKENGWIQAVIQFPTSIFKTKGQEKSLLILQKKSDELKAPREVLLAKVPNMTNKEAMELFFQKVDIWQEENAK
ncbi:class I SAM-dependent methyltransferase [Psychrobacillus lasiicapitis]|uniref:Class I SAM-dependent methyltransferase n=1 Tax=Psychrobacillus lasiicapitis TaxID=1636719 RepID=A0A544T944_9BACI|nr:class I SAM-dependent methyltransferase [Psychrobacillus lasiicapitis]TQR13965.1 class I SAM-dependent methyltransferase [Psychrobacillus lasiicapitis]GGA37012.1 adenine-specific DNA methyltransferase [Psychrobacillus lasiicapitis]